MSPLAYAILAPILAVVAAAYASVGLGGGTAYLSIVAAWRSDPATLRPISWTLNCVVASIGFVQFARRGHLDWGLAWPFLVGGPVGAVAGAALPIDPTAFRLILACTLGGLALRMLMASKPEERAPKTRPWLPSLVIGTTIGAVSGLIGMGGGIVLGPVIIALGWADAKRTAPVTCLYVLICSLGGLGGHAAQGGSFDLAGLGILGVAVAAGGLAGATWGAGRASPETLRRVFGVVALAAALKVGIGTVLAA